MAIITSDPHIWFVCKNKKGKTQTVFNNEHYHHNYPVTFQINFSDAATPQQNTVTLYNLTKEDREFYEKGSYCYVAFNWGSDKKILAEGYIDKNIGKPQNDGTTETFTLTFTEGTDYSNVKARKLKVDKTTTKTTTKTKTITNSKGKKVKHQYKTRSTVTKKVNKTYRKGTDYKSLIKGIAAQSGIKISKIDLVKNPKLKKSFTAKGKPLDLIKRLVKKTGSSFTYIRGKLEIINPKSKRRTWIEIDDQDLLEPPSYNEGNDDSGGDGTWEISVPLVPDITTNTGIHMMSKYLKGYYYVKAGQHSFDLDTAQTQCSLAKV